MRRTVFTGGTLVALAIASVSAQPESIKVRVAIPRDVIRDVIRDVGIPAADVAQNRNFSAEQTARETKTLALGASGVLDIGNLSGDINITGASGKDVQLEIIRRARGRSDADAKEGLEKVTVTVDQRGDRAIVRANYPDQGRQSYSVSITYNVTAPSGTRINAETMSGSITIKNMRDDISANVASGNIDITGLGKSTTAKALSGGVTVNGGESTGPVELSSLSGNIVVQDVKAHRLTVSVTSGEITARNVSADDVNCTATAGNVEYSGPIAKNGRYELHSHAGNVRFLPSGGSGYDVTARTFSGSVRSEVEMQNRSSSSSTNTSTRGGRTINRSNREMHGTVGDGSAVVSLSTFSGDVVIGKK